LTAVLTYFDISLIIRSTGQNGQQAGSEFELGTAAAALALLWTGVAGLPVFESFKTGG
jgi:hypothetical protein